MEWLFPLVSLSIIGTCFLNWASAYFILNKYELNLRTIVKKDWVAPFLLGHYSDLWDYGMDRG